MSEIYLISIFTIFACITLYKHIQIPDNSFVNTFSR